MITKLIENSIENGIKHQMLAVMTNSAHLQNICTILQKQTADLNSM